MSKFNPPHDPTPSQIMWEMNAEPLKNVSRLLDAGKGTRKAEVIQDLAYVHPHGLWPEFGGRWGSDELERKTTALKGAQPCLLIEVTDPATAALIAHDSRAGKYCLAAGDRHLAVPSRNERAFRNAVKKMGFVLPR
jgi:hypothetical protein